MTLLRNSHSESSKKHQHLGCINEVASRFTFGSLNEEQLRCLFLILGLRPAKYAVIRPRLFTLLDKNSEMQICGLADENKKYTGLIVKSNHVENSVRHKLEVNESQISAKFEYSHTFSTDIKQKCHFFEVFQFQRGCRTWNRSSPNVENSCLTVSVKLGQIRQIQK